MKALLINSLTSGGAERIVLNIYRRLRDKGQDIILICLSDNNVYEVYENDKIINLSKANFNDRGINLIKIFLFPVILFRLYKVVKQHHIQIVQSHLFLASAVNVLSRLIFRGKYKVQIVSHMYLSYETGLIGKIKLWILKKVYNRADLLISISEKMKLDIQRNILEKEVKHIVITNPHNVQEIMESAKKGFSFRFENDKKYIVTCGRLVPRKKVDVLIEAFSFLRKDFPEMELIILGEGEEMQNLLDQAARLQLTGSVHFMGHVNNPFNYIAASDYFILSSESEGLPNVIIESMVCRTLVISTDCPTGPRELLAPKTDLDTIIGTSFETGDFGILVPIGSATAIAEAVKHCLGHPDWVRETEQKAFDFSGNFSLEKKILEYESVLY